jgi:hypothetical protein
VTEFQREYVWSKEQAKQLLVSLFKGYLVGGLFTWKTHTLPSLKTSRNCPINWALSWCSSTASSDGTNVPVVITFEARKIF